MPRNAITSAIKRNDLAYLQENFDGFIKKYDDLDVFHQEYMRLSAKKGNLEILKWFCDQGLTLMLTRLDIANIANRNNGLNVIEWFKEKGYIHDKIMCYEHMFNKIENSPINHEAMRSIYVEQIDTDIPCNDTSADETDVDEDHFHDNYKAEYEAASALVTYYIKPPAYTGATDDVVTFYD